MKRALAFLMSLMLTASLLTGCGGGETPQIDTPEDEAVAAPASEEAAAEDIITDFGGETVVVGLYCGDDSVPGKDRIFKKINEYYMENYNIDVQFVTANMGDYAQSINMMLSSGEQMDIFSSGVMGFSNTVSNESAYDLYQDDLINKYGKDILELVILPS